MKTTIILGLLFVTLVNPILNAGSPLFPNSVVSNDVDFILENDADAFVSLAFVGREDKEMPDSRNDNLFDNNTFVFEALFANGKKVGIWCHSAFGSQTLAQAYADKLCPRLGKLPQVQRDMLSHVVIHKGDATAFSETEGHFFVLYSDNMEARIATHDLEETVFHESVHASLQDTYEDTKEWTDAQAADPSFVTDYAKRLPHLEDMPETALFAYTLIKHPGRLNADIERWLKENIPHRIAFFRTIYAAEVASLTKLKQSSLAYPNPTDGPLTIVLDRVLKGSLIHIYNEVGTMVKTLPAVQGRNELDVSEFSSGTYFLCADHYETMTFLKF